VTAVTSLKGFRRPTALTERHYRTLAEVSKQNKTAFPQHVEPVLDIRQNKKNRLGKTQACVNFIFLNPLQTLIIQ
jgi:hypothetical protein